MGNVPDHAPKILDLKTSDDGEAPHKDVSEYDSEDMTIITLRKLVEITMMLLIIKAFNRTDRITKQSNHFQLTKFTINYSDKFRNDEMNFSGKSRLIGRNKLTGQAETKLITWITMDNKNV